MAKVITYQLAYRTDEEVSLCPACEARDDHECGALGPVRHGLHDGDCDGARHPGRRPAGTWGVLDADGLTVEDGLSESAARRQARQLRAEARDRHSHWYDQARHGFRACDLA